MRNTTPYLLIVALLLVLSTAKPATALPVSSGRTRAARNRNPGNIRCYEKWQGLAGIDDKGFCVFETYDLGLRAMIKTLATYYDKGFRTITAIISRYAPYTENPTQKYIEFVEKCSGINRNTTISFGNLDQVFNIVRCMVEMESGGELEVDRAWFNRAIAIL